MKIIFSKYHGAGNDFVLVDDRLQTFDSNNYDLVMRLCHRHFGIGADGLILLQNSAIADYKMLYYNADGKPSSLCGNGSRCLFSFATTLGLVTAQEAVFEASDGLHEIKHLPKGLIALKMNDILTKDILMKGEDFFINTGSPHHITIVPQIERVDVAVQGKQTRDSYGSEGSNVNFIELLDENSIKIRTFERGVEAETLSCGTGVTAAAISRMFTNAALGKVKVKAYGGDFTVEASYGSMVISNIWLSGPVEFVFSGEINMPKA